MSIITVDYAKALLGISDTYQDAQLAAVIPLVNSSIVSHLGYDPNSQDYIETMDGSGDNFIRTSALPITALTSITIDGVVYANTNFVFQANTGLIKFKNGSFGHDFQNVVVTYTAGWTTMPGAITQAAILMMKKCMAFVGSNGDLKSLTINDQSFSFQGLLDISTGMNPEIALILQPYKTVDA